MGKEIREDATKCKHLENFATRGPQICLYLAARDLPSLKFRLEFSGTLDNEWKCFTEEYLAHFR
eukprot:4662073-Amphidinium_carterae.2